MTDLQSFIVGIIGTMPYGLEFLLPIFTFLMLVIGLILISIIFLVFFKVIRG